MSFILSKLINLAGNITGVLGISNGGTGQTTASAAFNALSPITTTGDIIYSSSGTTNARLAIGTNGKFLRAGSSTPAYGWDNINSVSSADYTITDTDGYDVIDMTTGNSNRTVTLPVPTNNTGRQITIKKVDSGTGFTIINRQTSGTIDGLTSISLYAQYDFITLFCDGTNWFIKSIKQTIYLRSTGATNAASTSTPFKNVSRVDTSGSYSGTTGQFTVPTPGYYAIWASAYSGGIFSTKIYINGSIVQQGSIATVASPATSYYLYSRLSASDTIEYRPDASVTANGDDNLNYLNIMKVG